ncbi:TIR domain-containing protein [Brucella pseudogrignonensis]|uniref:TIR domain-containing protein n=1 Tax=Brucella pseudogrignonensis TaxID=419475 RepID=UPI0038B463AE
MKFNLFIGSSSEQLPVAYAVQSCLQYDAFTIPWVQGVFGPSQYPLEALEDALDRADFAILICCPEDKTIMRKIEYPTVRDNVIFELGMALGKLGRKRTFLISPKDVQMHLPSDLNGISPEHFDQDLFKTNAEAALGGACAKIRKSMQELGGRAGRNTQEIQISPQEKVESRDGSKHVAVSLDWTLKDFHFQHFMAVFDENEALLIEIDNNFRHSKYAVSPVAIARWDALVEINKMMLGKKGDLATIRRCAGEFPQDATLKELLGQGLQHYGDPIGAYAAFDEATLLTKDAVILARIINRIISSSEEFDVSKEKINSLISVIRSSDVNNDEERGEVAGALHKIAKLSGMDHLSKAISEVNISIKPEDIYLRFNLAYQYQDVGFEALAMLHYEAIPSKERTGTAWNNLGVSYERLNLKGHAVVSYQTASAKEESLADANLAKKLLNVGFFEDARKRIELTKYDGNYHESVVETLSTIKSTEAAEEQEIVKQRQNAHALQRMILAIGTSALSEAKQDLLGAWETEFGKLVFHLGDDDKYLGAVFAESEVKSLGLGGFFGSTSIVEKTKITIKLVRFGNAFEGTVTKERSPEPISLLSTIDRVQNIILRISDDGNTLSGFEMSHQANPIKWIRVKEPKTLEHSVSSELLNNAK